jgi:hypothetical protein
LSPQILLAKAGLAASAGKVSVGIKATAPLMSSPARAGAGKARDGA